MIVQVQIHWVLNKTEMDPCHFQFFMLEDWHLSYLWALVWS